MLPPSVVGAQLIKAAWLACFPQGKIAALVRGMIYGDNTASMRAIKDLPPLAPSSLTVKSASPNQINLTWKDNSIGEGGFQIKRCQGANCKTFTSVAQLGQNVTAFSNTGLTPGVSYTYYVYAYNECGNSLSSNYVTVVTPLPPR